MPRTSKRPQAAVKAPVAAQVGTRVALALAVMIMVGLAAYGYGLSFPFIKYSPTPVENAAPTLTTKPQTPTQLCDMNPVSQNGHGRCYPGCKTDADCSDASTGQVGAYVATYEACKAKAITLCGPSQACVEGTCGPEKPVCLGAANGAGFCTRPNFSLTEAQCSKTAPGYGSSITEPVCSPTRGSCFQTCGKNLDCLSDADKEIYASCLKLANESCLIQTDENSAATLDQACFDAKKATCATQTSGKCLLKTGLCAAANTAKTQQECTGTPSTASAYSPTATGTVWIGTCIANGKECRGNADCPSRTPVPGLWVGMCPAASTAVSYANCLPGATGFCKQPPRDPNTCSKDPSSRSGTGKCLRECSSNSDCPNTDRAACLQAAQKKCTDALGTINTLCFAVAKNSCPEGNLCTQEIGGKKYCSVATGATTLQECTAPSGGVWKPATPSNTTWVGTCGDTTRLCRESRDCAPPPPPTTCDKSSAAQGGPGKCVKACQTNNDCPTSDRNICIQAVKKVCGADQVCAADLIKKSCPELNVCMPDAVGNKYCTVAGTFIQQECIAAQTNPLAAQQTTSVAWVGTCGTTQRQCRESKDCTATPGTPTGGTTDRCDKNICFPPCLTNAQCGDQNVYKACHANAKTLCNAKIGLQTSFQTANALDTCIASICGPETPTCNLSTHTCSLPVFGKNEGSCKLLTVRDAVQGGTETVYYGKSVGTCMNSKAYCMTASDCTKNAMDSTILKTITTGETPLKSPTEYTGSIKP